LEDADRSTPGGVGVKIFRMLSVVACALASGALPSPASAVSTTLGVATPQGSKRADFKFGSYESFDYFDVSGTIEMDVELASSPLDSTLQITGADLQLTDMKFDSGPAFVVETQDLVATLSTSVLTAVAFDGVDTYSFDLTGAEFAINGGTASIRGNLPPFSNTVDMAYSPIDLNFDPGAIALLTVTSVGGLLTFDLLIPLDVSGVNIAGSGPNELRFSEQQLAMTGTAIPEPSTLSLLASGLALVSFFRRRVS
jgi:hypothetical protein